ncbi:tyrosine-type recombinase/integrase [Chloroflexota bacterium]
MLLSKAIKGYLLDAAAGELSTSTSRVYKYYLRIFLGYLGDVELEKIMGEDLVEYLVYLRTDYKPNRPSGDISPLSYSALDNHWKCLRSFFGWCERILEIERPDKYLPRPKGKVPEVRPFSQDDIKALVDGCLKGGVASRPTGARDKAIIMLMLDTGIRIGELLRLRVGDANIESGEVYIRPFESSIKSKSRTVFIGKATRRIIWMHLSERDSLVPESPLFDIRYQAIRMVLRRLGERVGVDRVRPHRFRHTFAIQYLRNGGDVFTLQRLLGHSSLEMVRHYLRLADADAEDAHRRASPVDRWGL